MFQDFLKRLTQPEPAPLDDGDARLALAALLVRIARTDGVYDPAEIERIDRVLTKRYALSPFEVTKLRGEAETLESEAPDTVRFTRAIKDAVDYEDRAQVVEALWDIVLADGERDHEEDALMRLVAPMLGINDRDSALARQRVEARRTAT
ncbi:MAG: TerB family tellurite resistance protein [Pseudomonadota bacterium]